jgi:putative RecB family exonuclease
VAPATVGPAGAEEVVPRRPALSPSRAADFKQCPLLYRFRAIDRLPEVSSPAQIRGTLVHAVLDRLFTLPAAERVPAAAHELVGPVWAELCAADPSLATVPEHTVPEHTVPEHTAPGVTVSGDHTPGDAAQAEQDGVPKGSAPATAPGGTGPLIDAYFALEDPRQLEPEARELLVEAELESGLLLRGYVDRVDRVDRVDPMRTGPGDPAPGVRVVDYKTGSAPGPAREAYALFQLKFYALVLLRLTGRAPEELRLMYLTGPEVLSYTPDEEQLHRFGRMLDALWAAIRAAAATGDFRPNPGRACSWCSHRGLCPAWDGVPPPYPGMPQDPGADPGTDDADRAAPRGAVAETPVAAGVRP